MPPIQPLARPALAVTRSTPAISAWIGRSRPAIAPLPWLQTCTARRKHARHRGPLSASTTTQFGYTWRIRDERSRVPATTTSPCSRESFPRRRIMRRISFLIFALLACLVSVQWVQAQGEITTFDAPGAGTGPAQGTQPEQITAAGTIVGYYIDGNNVDHGFVRSSHGKFVTFDMPGGGTGYHQGTKAFGITQSGRIVGFYIDANGVRHGYVRGPDGKFATFDALGAGTGSGQGTFAAAINAAGTISGQYVDANDVSHGFVRTVDGTITSFDPPGSAYTSADILAINSAGTIAVQYFDSNNVSHGAVRAADGTITTF